MKNIGSELGGLLKKICLWGGGMAVVFWAFTLLWGFDITQLAGFALGWGYMCLCMYYLGVTCEKAVELEGKKAKRTMLGCYMTRYGVLFVLCAGAMLTKAVSAVGILLPQFYPRIILYVIQIRERRDK